MKRIWFAVVFLAICVALCFCEQRYIYDVHYNLNKKIIVAENSPSEESINDIKDYWKKANTLLNALCNSDAINELNSEIIYLDMQDEEIGASLAKVRSTNESFFHAQLINFQNIF